MFFAAVKTCPDVTITDSNVTAVAGQYGDIVAVACSLGFQHNDGTIFDIMCNENGSWNTSTCERK